MKRVERLYQRLPGNRLVSFGTRSSLWLAPDHLLALERTVASERYRRFYLRDIEAVVIRRTPRRGAFNFVCFILIVISALPAIELGLESRTALIWSSVLVALWLVLALVNTLRGAGCDTRIRTAVQIEPLPSLGRIPAAKKALARIKPLIEQAQGALAQEALFGADLTEGPATGLPTGTREGEPETSLAPARRNVHAALFSILVVSGIISLAEGTSPTPVSTVLDVLFSFVALILLVFALRLQAGSNFSRGVKRVTWGVVGMFMAGIVVGFVYGILYAVRHQGQQPADPLFFRSEPGFAMVQLGAGGVAMVLGLAGLMLLFKKDRSQMSAAVETPSPTSEEP